MKNTIKLLALACAATVMLTACANENVTPAVNNSTPKESSSSVITTSNEAQSETDKNSSTSSEEVSTGIVEYGICDVWNDKAGISYRDIMGVIDYSGTPVNVVIPENYEGKPIEGIKGSAFEECTSLESVIMPDSIKGIGSYAFYECASLKSVTISNNVTYIGVGAFQGCASLENVTIPDRVVYIGELAFDGCKSIKSIEIPNSVKTLEELAFGDCFNIQATYKGNTYDYDHLEDLYKAVNGE